MRWIRFTSAADTAWGVVEGDRVVETRGDAFAEWQRTGRTFALTDVTIEVPLIPRTFHCAGLDCVRPGNA